MDFMGLWPSKAMDFFSMQYGRVPSTILRSWHGGDGMVLREIGTQLERWSHESYIWVYGIIDIGT